MITNYVYYFAIGFFSSMISSLIFALTNYFVHKTINLMRERKKQDDDI